MINETLFDHITPGDRTDLFLAVASSTDASELALYFAIRCFYKAPNLALARVVQTTFMGTRGKLLVQGISTNLTQQLAQSISTWDQFERTGQGSASTIGTYKKTLFDAIWSQVAGSLGKKIFYNFLRNLHGNNLLSSVNVTKGTRKGYAKEIATLQTQGITFEAY